MRGFTVGGVAVNANALEEGPGNERILPSARVVQHAAILGTVSAATWEDTLAQEQARAGGGFILFDLWPTPARQARLMQMLHGIGRAADLYQLDTTDPSRDRWNPMLAGTPDEIVAKLLSLWRPPAGSERTVFADGLRLLVSALQAGRLRYTLGNMLSLWRQPELLFGLSEKLPVGPERTALEAWLASFGEPGRAGLLLQRLSSGWSRHVDDLLRHRGSRTFNSTLPTLDLDALITAGKCLYVPVLRYDPTSMANARLVALELGQAVQRLRGRHGAPFLALLGDLARLAMGGVGAAALFAPSFAQDAARANVGIVLTMPADEASHEGGNFAHALLRSVGTRLLCATRGSAFQPSVPAEALLIREGAARCSVRAAVIETDTSAPTLVRHGLLLPAQGESMLVLDLGTIEPEDGSLAVPLPEAPRFALVTH